ncbi:Phenylacetate-coenzyme A ligase PaaK, adenylate-forming domain family [Amycolatopsis xylanica]|uniref:Phenylacetate-coenzyme A ligase PaaK, adenylate-forming domain family n=2 Tax=Amycolatopsis xylanica TaxID=589385 RepID=A0A1H3PJS6_9PSEU|nr:Phenylacetate-coenzyme A ligase PaaK, adenylate-forming domain family [Amycolatopsis xylanica]
MELTGEQASAFARANAELAASVASERVAAKREKIERMLGFDREAGEERLNRLLRHAVARVPFYRDGPSAFSDFPLVGKADLRDRFFDFLSRGPDGRMEPGTYFLNQTSGSTGEPVRILATVETGGMANAVILERINRHLGVEDGGITLNVGLLYERTPMFEPVALPSPTVKCNLRGFDPGSPGIVADYAATVGRFPVEKITGSSSRVIALARYCAERGITLRPKAIIATYEHMPDSGRALVEETFGRKVTMLYATSETGYSAWECSRGRLHFQDDLVRPEIVPDDGAGGGGIVLTHLLSTPMPIIRYVTGDRAAAPVPCDCGLPGTAIEQLLGRARTSLVGAGHELYSPFALMAALVAAGLPDYQIVQEAPGLLDLIVPPSWSGADETVRDINARLALSFRPREGFRLRARPSGAFVLTESGKRNPVVQLLDLPSVPERTGYLKS